MRHWSIETGILERVYDLDRGTTQVLIEHGFLAGYVERSSTNLRPEELIEILRDHRAAIDLVHDCVSQTRRLTAGFINDLHSVLTRHQETVEAKDQFGKTVFLPLRRGAHKEFPNNPTRPDGTVHEYSPPIHVPSEMENLLRWHDEYQEDNSVIVAAWLHHRFTQIHPYQDGNGRVARALANLVLIKGEFFPVVVSRDQRTQYIEALETADSGSLKPLVRLFAEIQKKTILEALSVAPDSKPSLKVVEGVVDAIASKLKRRKEEAKKKLRSVDGIAEALQEHAAKHLRATAQQVRQRLNLAGGLDIENPQVLLGGPNRMSNSKPTEHWYHYQVSQTAQQAKQRANFNEHHYFVRVRLSSGELPWLDYIVSFHHVGQELSGVMEVTAFAEVSYPEEEESKSRSVQCMDRPFTITYQDKPEAIQSRLVEWVNETFTIAVKNWGDIL